MLQVVAVGGSLSDALDVSVDDLLVALEREDQGDVHGDTLGQVAVMAGRPSRVAGILIMAFGRLTFSRVPQPAWRCSRCRGPDAGRPRWRRAAVDEVGSLSDLAEDVGGVAHVGGGELADSGLNVNLAEPLS